MAHPFDATLDGLMAVLNPEPSRSHADQVRAADRAIAALEALLAAAHDGERPMDARPGAGNKSWIIRIGDVGSAYLTDRGDGHVKLDVQMDGANTDCTCVVKARWRKPTAKTFRDGASLFLHVARQIADQREATVTATRLRRIAVANLALGASSVGMRIATPWSLPVVVTTGGPSAVDSRPYEISEDEHVVSIECADSFDGTVIAIEPYRVVLNANEVDAIEAMRSVAELEAERMPIARTPNADNAERSPS